MTRLDRRTLLGTLGTGLAASLAGCWGSDCDTCEAVELDPEQVTRALSTPVPEYETPAPVTPAQSAIEAGFDRIDDLLAAVPTDLTAADVPNGAIRQSIAERREEAVEEREEVAAVADTYRQLRRTPYARGLAAEASVAFRAVEGETTLAGVRAQQEALSERVATDLQRLAYVGSDRDRALFLAQRLEYDLLGAERGLERSLRAVDPSVLDVGELGGRVEDARATREVVAHLDTRHRARLTDTRSFGGAFRRALERTIDAAAERKLPERGDEPSDLVDTDVGDGPRSMVLGHCLRALIDAEGLLDHRLAEGRLAAGLERSYAFERDFRACERIRTRIDDVETLDGIDPFWEARERAIRLAREADVDPDAPTLPAAMRSRLAGRIRSTDEEVRRTLDREETVHAEDVEWSYANYVWVGELLRALPDAVDAMADRLDA